MNYWNRENMKINSGLIQKDGDNRYCSDCGLHYMKNKSALHQKYHNNLKLFIDNNGEPFLEVLKGGEAFRETCYKGITNAVNEDALLYYTEELIMSNYMQVARARFFNTQLTYDQYAAMFIRSILADSCNRDSNLIMGLQIMRDRYYGVLPGLEDGARASFTAEGLKIVNAKQF